MSNIPPRYESRSSTPWGGQAIPCLLNRSFSTGFDPHSDLNVLEQRGALQDSLRMAAKLSIAIVGRPSNHRILLGSEGPAREARQCCDVLRCAAIDTW